MNKKSKPKYIETKILIDISEFDNSYTGYAECPYCEYETEVECCDACIKSKSNSGSLFCSDCYLNDRCSHFNYRENDTVIFSEDSYINKKKCRHIIMAPGIDSYNRFDSFIENIPTLTHAEYWYCLREAYQDSDNTYYYRHYLRALFSAQKPYRNNLMKKREIDFIKNLPAKLKIFRGMTVDEADSKKYGVSWSLDPSKALFFKDKYGRNYATKDKEKTIIDLDIDKQDVIAYWSDRDEKEIIYVHNKESRIPIDDIINEMEEDPDPFSPKEMQREKISLEILNNKLFPHQEV